MQTLFNQQGFGYRVKAQVAARGGYRLAARECRVAPSVLHLVSNGQSPGIETYYRLTEWMTGQKPWQ